MLAHQLGQKMIIQGTVTASLTQSGNLVFIAKTMKCLLVLLQ